MPVLSSNRHIGPVSLGAPVCNHADARFRHRLDAGLPRDSPGVGCSQERHVVATALATHSVPDNVPLAVGVPPADY